MNSVREYLDFSIISYHECDKAYTLLKGKCNSAIFFDARESSKNAADAQFYTIHKDNEIIIALRGSSSLSDFMTDAMFRYADAKEICGSDSARVHRGFLGQFESIKGPLLNVLSSQTIKTVTFVGHSLGGALATISSVYTKTLFPNYFVKCVTFGSPRVGNQSFVDVFDKSVDMSLRYVNGQDIVTTRPYWGYAHVMGLVQIGQYSMWKYFGSVEDHRTDEYLKSLA
jgi:predicted lipase